MKSVSPRGEGIFTFLWTMLRKSFPLPVMRSLSSSSSRSCLVISLMASLIRTESEACLWSVRICSARCWNCLGLISSAPILRGLSMLLDETSRNLLANSWVSRRYFLRISSAVSEEKSSGIADTSRSWLSLIMNPFSSKETSWTMMPSRSAIPANMYPRARLKPRPRQVVTT